MSSISTAIERNIQMSSSEVESKPASVPDPGKVGPVRDGDRNGGLTRSLRLGVSLPHGV